MKDIGTALMANLNLFTEFSSSAEATAQWWNHVKADLESPTPTLLPFEKGSSEIFSKWAETQQGFQQYHNVVRLYFCRRVLPHAERGSNPDITLGKLSAHALPKILHIFQHGLLTMWTSRGHENP